MADHAHVETLALREQFDTAEQQKNASTLGMWIFLITEIMFFGGMFLAYTVYRLRDPAEFEAGSAHLNLTFGAVNTVVLLTSSLTMVVFPCPFSPIKATRSPGSMRRFKSLKTGSLRPG